MKVLNFGSLNYDHVYQMDHFVAPKETQSSLGYARGFGGKGLNQSIALAKAGVEVYHAGKVGNDGQDFIDYLRKYGVHTDYLKKADDEATGHAIIQVCKGENCIILYGGSNQSITPEEVDQVLVHFEAGDVLLIQNEISSLAYLIEKAHGKGMKIAFNVAPANEKIWGYPLELIDTFIVNEVEGAFLAGGDASDIGGVKKALQEKYPQKEIVLTLGGDGSSYLHGAEEISQPAYPTDVVDTTAAGDTFTGYYLAMILQGRGVKEALDIASRAASYTCQGAGAAQSIPSLADLHL